MVVPIPAPLANRLAAMCDEIGRRVTDGSIRSKASLASFFLRHTRSIPTVRGYCHFFNTQLLPCAHCYSATDVARGEIFWALLVILDAYVASRQAYLQ